MACILETSLGDITIDLLPDLAPKCCENFLKLCKLKYYNYAPIHTVQSNFTLQTGDPIGPWSTASDGGISIWGLLDPTAQDPAQSSRKTFEPEFHATLKHVSRGTVSMATAPHPNDPDKRVAASQFSITLGDDLGSQLDGKAAIFGHVAEGFDVLEKINAAFVDDKGRPLKDIRIRHTIVLDEADIPDPSGFPANPPDSPVPTQAQLATVRIADDAPLDDPTPADVEAAEAARRARDARQQALTLEMVGDLPFAEVAPPENVLFVCKLNPVTGDEDLELLFGRFGTILSCEVIRDKRTGDSLQYAFVEYKEKEDAERAYFKMQDVLVDDHRIHVDFSQSVSRLADVWRDAAVKKRTRGGGRGFGGIEGLEKKRQYRSEADNVGARNRAGGARYGFVVDEEEAARRVSKRDMDEDRADKADRDERRHDRRRSRSPPYQGRAYDGARQARGHDRNGGDRSRDNARDRYRSRSRSRSRSGDRDRNRRRGYEKDRDRGSHRNGGDHRHEPRRHDTDRRHRR